MGVDGEPGEIEADATHDVGRLAPDTRQRHEILEARRHLAAKALFDGGGHADDALRLVLVEACRSDQLGDLAWISCGEVGGCRVAAEQLWGHQVDAHVRGLGRQDRRHEQLPRAAMVELAHGVGVFERQPPGYLACSALRRSRFRHRVARSFATVALMGSEPAAEPPATTRQQLDATSAVNVQRMLREAAQADGFAGLSDQLAADLDDVIDGADRAADDTVVVQPAGVAGFAIASRRDGGWTMQTVTDPRHRQHGRATPLLVDAILSAIADAGGGRVDWWVYAPTDTDDDAAVNAGLRRDRDLLQMRRDLPTERHADVATRPFRPGDEKSWLAVNNRAFAGHHEQHGWTLDTLRQRMRQPWFDPVDLRLYERDGRLAAFCWTKRHDDTLYEIYVIGVDPDFQGLGLGKQLTLAGLDHMASRGATEALLYVAAENKPALGMYENLGFTVHRIDRAYVGEVSSPGR
jgi:mycothiol synthase